MIALRIFRKIISPYSSKKKSNIRVLYVAQALIPTLQLSFIKPLADLVESGCLSIELVSEQQMQKRFGILFYNRYVRKWIDLRMKIFNPTIIVFCRYSGPHAKYIIQWSKKRKVATILHIDDDLLNIPLEIGYKKYLRHNKPHRLAAIKYLLSSVSLVYASTEALRQRYVNYGCKNTIEVSQIYCSGQVLTPAINRPIKKIGYMGFDHAHDFQLVLPAIIKVLRDYPHIDFQLFGSIPKPKQLDEFGERVQVIPPIHDYNAFMTKFSTLNWDIGLCPLVTSSFNMVKANTKWVEYTSVGAAVIASSCLVYDTCCADNNGVLIKTNSSDEWFKAIEMLVSDSQYRFDLVVRAQGNLKQNYSIARLREQVLRIFKKAHAIENNKVYAV